MTNETSDEYRDSVWADPENNPNVPRKCPHCEQALAHPDDLQDNEDIDANGLFRAYRQHRKTHFDWGEEPRTHTSGFGDPYLGSYYDGDKDALWTPSDEEDTTGDPDEVVGQIFDVDLRFEATVRARVVAPNKSRAKEKADELRIRGDEDLSGHVPIAELTHQVHADTVEIDEVTREQTELAERMEGWPW